MGGEGAFLVRTVTVLNCFVVIYLLKFLGRRKRILSFELKR